MAYKLSKNGQQRVREIAGRYPEPKSAILPALHIVVAERGYVDKEACDHISGLLDVPPIHLYEAMTFYTYFPQKPVGNYHIQVCHNISCNLRDAEELYAYLEEKHGIKEDEVTADGLFCLHRVECLGACGNAPVMQVNDDYYENLTLERVDELIEGWRKNGGNGSE